MSYVRHNAHSRFARARPAYRWRHAVSLARVTASEFGRPAPGVEEARSLLSVTKPAVG